VAERTLGGGHVLEGLQGCQAHVHLAVEQGVQQQLRLVLQIIISKKKKIFIL